MAALEAQPRTSAEFVESSVLEVVVSADAEIDFKEEIQAWDGVIEDERNPLLPFITQRPLLLFGKTLHTQCMLCLTYG